ncbi:uncharacterized protein LOC135949620 [Calliphora vicina]|uniref:uncharacterized protein LOC135949620 n=1 Tax=Calliphora vicina TaxID=7373 RepID=UPI00325C2AE4
MHDYAKKKKQLFWSRKMIEMFIGLYKESVCLYDISHQDYNNNTVKTSVLANILQKMQTFLPNLELKDVLDKIKVIHGQLSEEISYVDAGEASGNTYAPKMWCFDQLKFLHQHIRDWTADGNLNEINNFLEDSHNDDPDDDDDHSDDTDVFLKTIINNLKPAPIYKWERSETKIFIKLLEGYTILYDPKHKHYSHPELRRKARIKLLKETRKIDPKISMKNVHTKMTNLRKAYTTELCRFKKSQENNEIFNSKLWCFEMLDNLYKHKINTTSNCKPKNEAAVNDAYLHFQVDDDGKNIQPSVTSCDYKEYCDNTETDFKEANKLTKTKCSTIAENSNKRKNMGGEDANYEWLGDLVVSKLGEMSTKSHTEFAWDVQCLIRKYVLKSKTDNEEISSSTSSSAPTSVTNNQKQRSIPHNIAIPRSSNVSFNISFV